MICWNNSHLIWSIIAFSAMAFFGLCLPIYILCIIIKAKSHHSLRSDRFISRFGTFTLPYVESASYYEILLIFFKISVVILKEFFIRENITWDLMLMIIIYLFYLIIFYLIHRVFRPYDINKHSVLAETEKKMIQYLYVPFLNIFIFSLIPD